ncbi:MAG: hypothetical protein D6815_12260 [Candidatus Dadabacteria bacterium]|nr:MAG: hypothetical protein D6815_12260 [Candidatus Dadabacteria bacterium]
MLLAFGWSTASAQRRRPQPFAPLRLTDISGRIETGVRAERERRARANQGTSWRSEELEFDELLRLDLKGYSYHPRFLKYHLGFDFQALQRPINRGSDIFIVGGGNRQFFGGDWHLTFLEEHPYNLTLFGNVSERDIERSFSRTFRERSSLYGATSHIRKGPIPVSMTYQRWSRKRLDPALTLTEKGEDGLAQGRYEIGRHSRGTVEYRYRTEEIDERDLKLTRHEALASNTTTFAGSRRRRFYGSVRLFQQENQRAGTSAGQPSFRTREAYVFGNLDWQLTRNVSTFYHTDVQATETGEQNATIWNGSAAISHQLYESLTSTAELYSSVEDSNFGFTAFYGGRLGEVYTKTLGDWGRLSVTVNAFGEIRDRNPTEQMGQVFDERITLSTAPVALANPDVDDTSIVVTDLSGGVVYTRGADYVVIVTGRITQIQRLATGAIADGETVLVDYEYQLVAKSNILASGVNQNTSLSIGDFLTLYVRSTNNGQQLRSGSPDAQLESYDGYAVGVRNSWWWLTTTAEYETVRSSFIDYDSIVESITLTLPERRSVRGHIGGSYRFQDFSETGETVARTMVIGGASARFWQRGLATLDAEWQQERWTGRTTDNDLDGFGIRGRATYPYRNVDFELEGRLSRIDQRGEKEDRDRLIFRVRRRF